MVPKQRKPFHDGQRALPAYIEDGLSAGDEYVDKFVCNIVPQLKATSRSTNLVWLDELKSYLEEHGLIVSHTDKNLGIAVIKTEWAIENTRLLFNDPLNYRRLNALELDMWMERKHKSARECADQAAALGRKQLARFLRSKIPASDLEQSSLPRLYGIPKIHKRPVKMRPIVPCYNVVQAPAATYVSKMLRPLVKAQPYVLESSKDLARRLNALDLNDRRKKWLISGDIVAFYPNIPLGKCLKRVSQWWLRTEGADLSPEERRLFLSCFFLANRSLVVEFDGQYAEQIRGLAMGIACSPDVAQLYGAYCENTILERPDIKAKMPFFGRFLDDLLGIVYADTREEALAVAREIVYDDVEVEWEASEWHTPFLDLFVYIDPITGQVEHKPYSKPLNHKERIPWASHHPKDVKKGTYIGEMSRLATLCSKPEHYRDAIGDLQNLYISRGYPTALVRSWTREYYSERWNLRLSEPKGPSEVLVLKSSFNPVWSVFNAHELGAAVSDTWLSRLSEYDTLKSLARGSLGPKTPRHQIPSSGNANAELVEEIDEAARTERVRRVMGEVLPPSVIFSSFLREGEDGDPPVQVHPLQALVDAGLPRIPRELQYITPMAEVRRRKREEEAQARSRLIDELAEFEEPVPEAGSRSRNDTLHRMGRHTSRGHSPVRDVAPYSDSRSLAAMERGNTGVPQNSARSNVAASPGVVGSRLLDPSNPAGWGFVPTALDDRNRVIARMVDVRAIGFTDKKWIVSRKKTTNLADIVSSWKKTALQRAAESDEIQHTMDEWQ